MLNKFTLTQSKRISKRCTLNQTLIFEWFVFRCGSKNGYQKSRVYKRLSTTCSKYGSHSKINRRYDWEKTGGYIIILRATEHHLTSMRIFSVIVNKMISKWAPKSYVESSYKLDNHHTGKLHHTGKWKAPFRFANQLSRTSWVFHIPEEVGWLEKRNHLRPVCPPEVSCTRSDIRNEAKT